MWQTLLGLDFLPRASRPARQFRAKSTVKMRRKMLSDDIRVESGLANINTAYSKVQDRASTRSTKVIPSKIAVISVHDFLPLFPQHLPPDPCTTSLLLVSRISFQWFPRCLMLQLRRFSSLCSARDQRDSASAYLCLNWQTEKPLWKAMSLTRTTLVFRFCSKVAMVWRC